MPRKDENRRTLTDFKIVGLQIEDLDWSWGQLASLEEKVVELEPEAGDKDHEPKNVKDESNDSEPAVKIEVEDTKIEPPALKQEATLIISENPTAAPTARLRIYFHTPPNADDEKPIFATHSSDVRKGKRKKLDDDDPDLESGSGPRPPPNPEGPSSHVNGHERQPSVAVSVDREAVDRESVAPSVAETASEADWLMAAMTEGDADADADGELDESFEMTQIDQDMDADGEYDMDESVLDASNLRTELVVSEDVGTGGAREPSEPSGAGASTVDGATDQTSKYEVEPLVITTISSGGKQAGVGGADGNIAERASLKPEVEIMSSSAGEGSASLPASTSENGDAPNHLDLEKPDSTESAGDTVAVATEGHGPQGEQEHLPEPPASPVSNTVASSTSTGTNPEGASAPPPATKAPSANRLSISYASGTRRLLIDADIVEKMTVMRSEGRIEVAMSVERLADGFKGILIEALNEATNSYSSLTGLSEASGSDVTLPPFWKCASPAKIVLRVYLDKERPLTEPKWVKSGDVHEWLKDLLGGRFWVAGDAVGWEKRIEVTNPDPAQTILNVMESWAANSSVGMPGERQRFLKNHMTRPDNVLEILLRLVRGERATPFSQNSAQISGPSVTGPLLSAMEPTSYHAPQQTHVSLAVVAFVRLAEEFAELALGEGKGKTEVVESVGEIIRSLPHHLVYKSLDGMMKEWRSDKKHARP